MFLKPHRSVLSVPGHIERMHAKAAGTNADVVMLDLEDSVPIDAKVDARRQTVQSLQTVDWGNQVVTVRINGLETALAYQDVLAVIETAGDRVDAVVIPKVNAPGDIHFLDRLLSGIEKAKGWRRPVGIEASIETAEGMAAVFDIAAASSRLISLVFGIADYAASIGARTTSISGHGEETADDYPGHRWQFAIGRMVAAAKARGLLAIDAPYGHFKDPDGLKRNAAMGGALGCDGKWAIHPAQIDIINALYSPTREDIERAHRVLQADQEAREGGLGAVALDGRMVDQATVRLARRLYGQARQLRLIDGGDEGTGERTHG